MSSTKEKDTEEAPAIKQVPLRFRLSKNLCRKFKNKKLHKAGKAPSGRELDFAKQKTEGECANIKFDQNFK